MNARLFLIFFFVLSFAFKLKVTAQDEVRANFRVGIPDTNTRDFFDKHNNITDVAVEFMNNQFHFLHLFGPDVDKKLTRHKIESYKLTFEGDVYRLTKKYPQLKIPQPPSLLMRSITGVTTPSDKIFNSRLSIQIVKDTTYYEFHFTASSDKLVYDYVDDRPVFTGNKGHLKDKLKSIYDSSKAIAAKDSVVFFEGLVGANAKLIEVKPDNGYQSPLSQSIKELIEREANIWRVSRMSRLKAHEVTYFIRLNKDGSVSFDVL